MNLSSVQEENFQKYDKRRSNGGDESEQISQGYPKLYIVLAPESPHHISHDYEAFHDDSTYDSMHNFETDVCRDSSDDEKSCDGSTSSESFNVEVVEYELPSDSDNENYSSASSGSEDYGCFVKTVRVVDYNFKGNSSESDDEYIIADTGSESDGSIDPELGPADYWHCIRCLNKSNNPLYSMCERCYQERRELFPPRPKRHRKSEKKRNSKRKAPRRSMSVHHSSDIESETDIEEQQATKRFALMPARSNESSHSNGNEAHFNNENNFSKKIVNEKISSNGDECASSTASTSSLLSIELKRENESNVKSSHSDSKLDVKLENKFIQNVYRMECKDSGLSSSVESSQEFSDGRIVRSVSSGSTVSFDSQNDANETLVNTQSLSDDEEILKRADEFVIRKSEFSNAMNSNPLDSTETHLGVCNFCMSNKKDGVFVHSNSLHLCCCYKCAVKVWKKRKCCPICKQKIKNVTKLFAH